jgi:hypothetical protein
MRRRRNSDLVGDNLTPEYTGENSSKSLPNEMEETTQEIFNMESEPVPSIPEKKPYKSNLKLKDVWGNQYKRKRR